MRFSASRLDSLLAAFSRSKILVIGDLMLDEYLWGKVTRISPEAPVPILDIQQTAAYPGGAANVARNLVSLGAKTSLAGVIGDDEPGRQLLRLLGEREIVTRPIFKSSLRPTTHKARICAITRQLHDHLEIEDQQQIVRVDRESRAPLDAESKRWLFQRLRTEIATHDAIILEDYAKGLIDQELVTLVIGEAKKGGKIVAIDPNPKNPLEWSGATALKPNRHEAIAAAGLPESDASVPVAEDKVLRTAATLLHKRHEIEHLLITLGQVGMLLFEKDGQFYHSPTRAQEVFDVSGAGDTAIAAFTLALAAGATGIEAAEIANHAAGVVVAKLGTATLTVPELREMFVKTEGLE
jgi:D-beta-D-heptose 7-phosphate kinase/D-beta-D-heptose 1-phosphate adenosyltransferase